MGVTGKWTAADVAEALVRNYLDALTCANMFEFELPAEAEDEGKLTNWYRRADLLSIFCGGVSDKSPFLRERPSTPRSQSWLRTLPYGWRTAFEIKVSRADFRVDARQRYKHTPILRVVNEMFFAYPRGLVRIAEEPDYHNKDEDLLPYGAGAIEVWRDERKRWAGALRARIVRTPTINFQPETTREFVDQLVRRTLYGRATSGTWSLTLRSKSLINFRGELLVPSAADSTSPGQPPEEIIPEG